MKIFLITSLVVLVVAAGTASALLLLQRKKKKKLKPLSELQKSQVVEDLFDGHALMQWVEEAKQFSKPDTDMRLMIAKTTKKWIKALGYSFPKELDPEHNIIAVIVDMTTGQVLLPRLFSFDKLGDKIKEYFNGEDTFFLE